MGRFLLNIVVAQRAPILKLFTRENDTLLIGWNPKVASIPIGFNIFDGFFMLRRGTAANAISWLMQHHRETTTPDAIAWLMKLHRGTTAANAILRLMQSFRSALACQSSRRVFLVLSRKELFENS